MKRLFLLLLLLAQVSAASLMIPAVTSTGAGVSMELTCEVNPGKGRVLVATEPLVGLDTQHSEQQAVKAVTRELGVDLSDRDVIFIFEANQTRSVDGGSAGAAMALCLISELTGRELNPAVSITGTIREDGSIGPVSGILPKAKAISDTSSVFLVPEGQSTVSTYSKKYYSPRPGVYIEEVYPVQINLTEYATKNLGLRVVEVRNLKEAEEWFFSGEKFRKELPELRVPEFPDDLPRVRELAEYEVSRAKRVVKENSTGWEYLQKALQTPESLPYTRANYAFLAYVGSIGGEDVSIAAEQVKKQFENLDTSDPHWRGEAELRLSWALLGRDPEVARKEWLMLGVKMLTLENLSSEVVDREWVKELANKKILQAKEELERAKSSGSGVPDSEESVNFAVMSFNEGLYFGALYNALDAIAWARAYETSTQRLQELLLNSSRFEDDFAEAYRRHAFYLLANGDTDGAAFSFYRAELREKVFERSRFSLPSFRWPSLDLKWVAIILLAWVAFSGRRKKKVELNQKEMMLLAESKASAVRTLQKKLRNGEISEATYHRILRELE